ncbi:prokaryotic type I DNA topoisomerase [Sistotremastrum niveocremeum HHB9708]|uniref:DNA topoisomerase n=1 Tax=Sistotremastrum niveocremeum HHB9708 TaxID=1314777 RepID=A0A165AMB7_9AGAM|nr:prokaryotic type I DNA topoisomerase [Sistotremastrum niveocremeum HHB9708]
MPWPKVLCVAEKPSIAKSISQILSGGQYEVRNTTTPYIKNYEFSYPASQCEFIVTSVVGHLTEKEFTEAHKTWHSCDPFELFDAAVETRVPKDKISVKQNLSSQARRCERLVIWTDCDREGEAIGGEVADVCRQANRHIVVQRARFSAIIPQQIHHAAQNTVALDTAQIDAVEARVTLDLKLGAAFTRMQTTTLRPQIALLPDLISYGPCQFPTLGFVVSRYEQVQSFSPESFWYIFLSLNRALQHNGGEEVDAPEAEQAATVFTWGRVRLFEFEVSLAIYEGVLASRTARVQKITKAPTKKWKPMPLTTVELQKSGSRLLRLTPKTILDISEGLYQRGFLSYPRTETDQFDPDFDFNSLIEKQTLDPAWGPFANRLMQGEFRPPRRGKKNDQAHPPIHPTCYAGNLVGDEKRVYEYITRRFLACCAQDAEGFQTTVDVAYGGEEFSAKGLIVLRRNYLDVFIYDNWKGMVLPDFVEGEEFVPSVCELRDGQTTRPALLTEADLVGLMDKNGIGTDATIAQHIQTIIDREYVIPRMQGGTKYLLPSTLGIGLVEGYNEIGFDRSLSKPQLRRQTERTMVQVCQGIKSKHDMLNESIEQYKEVYVRARQQFDKVVGSVQRQLRGQAPRAGDVAVDDWPAHDGQDGDDDDNEGGGGGGGSRGARGSRGSRSRRGRGGTTRGAPSSRGRNARSGSKKDKYDDGQDPPPPSGSTHTTGNEYQSSTIGSANVTGKPHPPDCQCGQPAAERTVTKENENKGRAFWTCGNNKTCTFFEWVEGTSTEGAARASRGATLKRAPTDNELRPSRNQTVPSSCKCDLTPVMRTVNKEGPNKGRHFWVCPNSEKARCDHFVWDDEQKAEGVPQGRGAGGGGECYKCGQQGHFANGA